MAKALFKKKAEADLRNQRLRAWVSDGEKKAIEKNAEARNLDVGEFVRRAALGRRADVDFVTDIVLGLRELTGAIRALHAEFVARGIEPPSDELLSLIVAGRAAMLRISK